MIESFLSALSQFLAPSVLLLIVAAIPVGLIFGVLPGLGGLTALAILIPFIYGMEPLRGLAFLLAAHAVIYTGGSVTAIMLGIPGAPPNAATVIDGYPLSRQGKAGYAIGAALTSSALGGVLGVMVLILLLPFLQPVVEAFGSPETFFLALLGITFIAVLGEGQPLKGLIAGGLGIFLTCFGTERVSGIPRFWLDFEYLLDGFRLIPIALGLFAVPEIITMMSTGSSIAAQEGKEETISFRQVVDGVLSVFRHRWLFLRSSFIGVFVGIIPGVGGETAPFVAYASAQQISKHPEEFGKGTIEGVIAPESSNNAKEGGALVPTLAFGIPGSSAMALLLGGFLVLGLEPGPEFLKNHLDIAFGLALVVAVANVLAAAVMIAVAPKISLVTRIEGHVLGPLLLVLVVLGAYSTSNNAIDVVFVFVFGLLGYFMQALGFSRAPLLLGFVLGTAAETYLHISLNAYGAWFFLRPISMALGLTVIAAILWPLIRRFRGGAGNG